MGVRGSDPLNKTFLYVDYDSHRNKMAVSICWQQF